MMQEVMLALSSGFLVTIKLFVLTLIGSLPLGLLIAFTSMSRIRVIKVLSRTVVWIVRGTPLLLQLIVIYYGPGLMFGNNLWGGSNAGRFIAALVAFIFNYACYFSEIYRGGIESISKGQYEAGQVLGLTKRQIFFKIVLLQVIKRIIPPMGNELINLVKDTSLARVIAVYELIWAGQAFIKSSGIIWPLLMTGVFYLVFSGILVLAFNALEKKLSYFES
ncbi:MAG: amino acid ABC transporter permease [Emergencia sp.]|jgi:polar amino acid transport system permease protein|uniref:amino acid ABC transporter permease n=1 Tax=Emergencia sp. 1XD21-10 TaxID=2304569 RepID=UPI0013798B42|nr:amino acid ABC transporter permease [Emergencia sp. 1XD21-10]MCI9475070.1 amino acid ABC transporter permease [Emergencia sp.]MCI9638618.1 amino acid ABC transporter permease [Emergencia sp.]NCF00055.1 amino acid ABC transporter permease [Emergencia sp. 1XD21-10]